MTAPSAGTTLTDRTGHVFHGLVDDVVPGTKYALRVHGAWEPSAGLRHNPNKLLLDPHAVAISGDYTWGQAVFGHDMNHPEEMDTTDGAGSTPLCVVTADDFDWGDDAHPLVPLADTIVYETHVKGFTKLHPGVPDELRGTYAGLAHPAAIKHLTDLGVTAVELLPIHQFVQDNHLTDQGLRNYWGYNTIGFLAPHNEYSSCGDNGGQVNEFKSMVKALHAAGLEVILDVVYNHTAEGNELGPTLSFKGIDNEAYYRLVDGDQGHYFDTTGTGNSLNVSRPAALGLIMDSLRYWVTEMHVDGFRFDLATTLTRQGGDASHHSAFTDMIAQDPVLAPVKMIAEPWDTAGYQVGGFPSDWSEWNGKFRDDVRAFWSGEDSILGTVSQRILGSPDVYEADRRSPDAGVSFVTAHDGFTLHDLTSYNQKHNSANGEDNNDGESDNKSFNCGAEGPTDNDAVNEARCRARRNILATLLLSAGVPMILGGDELGRTQGGNNNAYCQDNDISWYPLGCRRYRPAPVHHRAHRSSAFESRPTAAVVPAGARGGRHRLGHDSPIRRRGVLTGRLGQPRGPDHHVHRGTPRGRRVLPAAQLGRERRRVHRPAGAERRMDPGPVERPGTGRRGPGHHVDHPRQFVHPPPLRPLTPTLPR